MGGGGSSCGGVPAREETTCRSVYCDSFMYCVIYWRNSPQHVYPCFHCLDKKCLNTQKSNSVSRWRGLCFQRTMLLFLYISTNPMKIPKPTRSVSRPFDFLSVSLSSEPIERKSSTTQIYSCVKRWWNNTPNGHSTIVLRKQEEIVLWFGTIFSGGLNPRQMFWWVFVCDWVTINRGVSVRGDKGPTVSLISVFLTALHHNTREPIHPLLVLVFPQNCLTSSGSKGENVFCLLFWDTVLVIASASLCVEFVFSQRPDSFLPNMIRLFVFCKDISMHKPYCCVECWTEYDVYPSIKQYTEPILLCSYS